MTLRRLTLALLYCLSLLMQPVAMAASLGTATATHTATATTTLQHLHAQHQHSALNNPASSKTSSHDMNCCQHDTSTNTKFGDAHQQQSCQDHKCCAHSCCAGSSCPPASAHKTLISSTTSKYHPADAAIPPQPIDTLKRPPKTTP